MKSAFYYRPLRSPKLWIVLLGWWGWIACGWAGEWRLAPFESSYVVRSSGLQIGKLQQNLRRLDNDRYAFRIETFATGLAALILKDRTVEESLFEVRDGRIVPLEYHFTRSGGNRPKTQKIVFDRGSAKIVGRTNDSDWQLPWQPAILFDNILYQLELLRDVARGKKDLNYILVDSGQTKTYRFERQGEERVSTPLGEFQTVKISRTQLADQRATTVWGAPRLSYFPVRIGNIDRKGRLATLLLERLRGIDAADRTTVSR